MGSAFCPRCGTPRVGAFRFCRSCQFDFDDIAHGAGVPGTAPASPTLQTPAPTWPPPPISGNAPVPSWPPPPVGENAPGGPPRTASPAGGLIGRAALVVALVAIVGLISLWFMNDQANRIRSQTTGPTGDAQEIMPPTLTPRQWTEADHTACYDAAYNIMARMSLDDAAPWKSISGREGLLAKADAFRAELSGAAKQLPQYFGVYYPFVITRLEPLRATIAKPMTADQFSLAATPINDFFGQFWGRASGPYRYDDPCAQIQEWLDANVKE